MYIVFKFEKSFLAFTKFYKKLIPSAHIVLNDKEGVIKNNRFTHIKHLLKTSSINSKTVHFCVFSLTNDNNKHIFKIIENLISGFGGNVVTKLNIKTKEREKILSESDLTLLNINIAVLEK